MLIVGQIIGEAEGALHEDEAEREGVEVRRIGDEVLARLEGKERGPGRPFAGVYRQRLMSQPMPQLAAFERTRPAGDEGRAWRVLRREP